MVKAFVKRTKDLFSRAGRNSSNNNSSNDKETDPAAAVTTTIVPIAEEEDVAPVVIVGAGIVGLVLALALEKHCGIRPEIYEQAPAFHDDVGAGMGMYPNGLRVIRDISPKLLQQIQEAGYPYLLRRYERHDGTEVATSEEKKLMGPETHETETEDLQPIGIRRWKLQKILFQAVQEAGIKIHFDKRLESLEQQQRQQQQQNEDESYNMTRLTFKDGTVRMARLLLGADGSKSQVRTLVSGGKYELKYTGTTCIMGSSTVPRQVRGLCLPSSETTRCHGAFYPTGEHEQCFQFHFPTTVEGHEKHAESSSSSSSPEVDPKQFSWGGLTHAVEQEECNKLADRLLEDGWDEKFILPLRNVDKALKIGFSTLEPHLESYIFGGGTIALVGDSAHPPVPYLGQGAQQGLEDAGTLALLLQHFCTTTTSSESSGTSSFSFADLEVALSLYNAIRLPRTSETLNRSKLWGKQQQKRAENHKYNQVREENIRREVFYHETLPILLPAVRHDYRQEVQTAIKAVETKKQQAKDAALLVQHNHPASSSGKSSDAASTDDHHHHLLPVPEETILRVLLT